MQEHKCSVNKVHPPQYFSENPLILDTNEFRDFVLPTLIVTQNFRRSALYVRPKYKQCA